MYWLAGIRATVPNQSCSTCRSRLRAPAAHAPAWLFLLIFAEGFFQKTGCT